MEGLTGLSSFEGFKKLGLVMCDSDIYSFLLSLNTMPQAQKNMMFSRMENQMKEAEAVLKPDFADAEKFELSRRIRYAMQDLYRFFKLYRKKDEFNDPFVNALKAKALDETAEILGIKDETIKQVADFFFKHNYWDEAAEILELVDHREPGLNGLWEKIGFCRQKVGDFGKAIEWYRKAELINPGNSWLEKNLAMSLRNAGRYKESIEYFKKSLDREPDNFHLLMSFGQALLEAGFYTEALDQFYHAQYLKPEHIGVERAIAWTELLIGNLDKAESKYLKILSGSKTDRNDWLNAGHTAMAKSDFDKAVGYYIKFIDESKNKNINDLILAFKDDGVTLRQLGIMTSDLRLVVDMIRYNLKEK